MQGDFSRNTFDPTKHFSRVLMQQGRVQLDADWNELNAVVFHYLRTLARDVFGPHGAKDTRAEKGFNITNYANGDFHISPGHLYVDGLLCENDERWGSDGRPIPLTYETQGNYPIRTEDPAAQGSFLVYLDVWERYVSALQDVEIREKALGGPDTAARAQILWQVRVEPFAAPGLTSILWQPLVQKWQPDNRGRLKVKVDTDTAAYKDPCIQSPSAGYRGAENHLYRIEVHTGGTAETATFKWSRENGSVVASWIETEGNNLVVDTARGFQADQWVELIDDSKELRALPGTLVKVSNVEGNLITIDPDTAKGPITRTDFPRNPRVRRWDQQETEELALSTVDRAIPILEPTDATQWIALEDGILIQFQPVQPQGAEANTYRTGDYWLVPARVATGNVEWPNDQDGKPRAVPPHGIHHVYAPLARIAGAAITDWRQALA
jgi:hypothetical protein